MTKDNVDRPRDGQELQPKKFTKINKKYFRHAKFHSREFMGKTEHVLKRGIPLSRSQI